MDTPETTIVEKTNPSSQISTPNNAKEMGVLDHLEELRWHIIRAVLAILVFTVVAFVGKDIVFGKIILGPSKINFLTYQFFCKMSSITCIDTLPFIIQNRVMTGQFTMHIAASIAFGFICAFPYVFWELWRFVAPALYQDEKQTARGATFFVSLLFAIGIFFGYFLISPLSINFLSNYQVDPTILNEIDISSYVTTVTMLTLGCGLMFQLPIVVFFLSQVGIVTPEIMKAYRKHSIVVILFISALITPPDVISQCLIGIPIWVLYEMSILISASIQRKRNATLAKMENTNAVS
ncbi:twin-arginine translocase subunit TatC [Bernardetia sp.]|uniref:twin-arginine translocase subunit TatC n=1 Tax=Bernardetia sp. TaxID=1937974 RepID=UPI0025BEDFA7|nr:twin-arginine translocase subunit TatC [Bernardetia sp.]